MDSKGAFSESKLEHCSSSDGQEMKALATRYENKMTKFGDANRRPKDSTGSKKWAQNGIILTFKTPNEQVPLNGLKKSFLKIKTRAS